MEAQKYGAILLRLRGVLRELQPQTHAQTWRTISKEGHAMLVARFELSSLSVHTSLRKAFHNLLLSYHTLPAEAKKAIGIFVSRILYAVDDEGPSVALIRELLAENNSPIVPTNVAPTDKITILSRLSEQHEALRRTLTQINEVSLAWPKLDSRPLKSTLSSQSQNMIDMFWLVLQNKLQIHLFKASQAISAGFTVNNSIHSAITSQGLRARRELEQILSQFTAEGETHFVHNAQLIELIDEFKAACRYQIEDAN